MKKNKIIPFLTSLFLLFVLSSSAQVSGLVTAEHKPLAGASVSLFNAKDSSLFKTAVTDTGGRFELDVPLSSFFISVSSTGFTPHSSLRFTLDTAKRSFAIPEIQLQKSAAGTLSTVTVTAKKPMIERRADRTIVNVDAMITSAGSNALEVLEKSPGVQVDNNDAISLKGKSGVAIYIDDKPTYLSGSDLASYLKSLPAGMLDKIEIMTTPPAKYDAAGNAGIINIKTKKNKQKGFNGSINPSLRQGKYFDSRNNLNFNYRNNKFNLFSNIAFSAGNQYNGLTITRDYTKPDGTPESGFWQNSYIKRNYSNLVAKIGIDYSPGKKTTLGFIFNSIGRPSTEKRNNTGIFSDPHNVTDSIILADNREKERFGNKSFNFSYRYQFDSLGRELSMDLDYIRYTTSNDQLFKNASFDAGNNPKTSDELSGALPSALNIYAYKADYTHPLKKDAKIEAGIKTSFIRTNNIAEYFTRVNNVTSPDYDKTNHFIYRENINAAYLNFSREFKKLSVQLGLRLENTVSNGHQLGNPQKPDSSFKRSYTNLFPTVFLSYKPDSAANHQFSFSYSRRIDRPYYADLNPFVSPLDKFTYYAGNPFLNPQFTHHFELSYSYKNFLNTSVFYDRIKDEMNETIELSGNTFISRTGNIGKKDFIAASVDATIKPAKWWTILPYIQYNYLHTRSKIYTEDVNTKGGFWHAALTNQFVLSKSWSMELLGRYRSAITDGQFKLWQMGLTNIGIVKKLMKDKGSVKLVFQDIFRTRINQGDINSLKNGSGYYKNLGDTRAVVFAFTYRFSKGAKASQQSRKGGAESEQNRVKE